MKIKTMICEKYKHGLTSPPVLLISSANLFREFALRAIRATLYPALAKRRLFFKGICQLSAD
jgi:hypothetical protein